jgi:hypothetical protein
MIKKIKQKLCELVCKILMVLHNVYVVMNVTVKRRNNNEEKNTSSKKGKGIRALKAKAPKLAAKMGYEKGGMVSKRNKTSREMFKIAQGKK